jgi:hypothetical protein
VINPSTVQYHGRSGRGLFENIAFVFVGRDWVENGKASITITGVTPYV